MNKPSNSLFLIASKSLWLELLPQTQGKAIMFKCETSGKLVVIFQKNVERKYLVKENHRLHLTTALEILVLFPIWGFIFYLLSMRFQEWNSSASIYII